ncbi:hypothetical protein FWH13_01815 [Candidatus Saccharibacteria bacterium]|nr:hypothetical protein [Candidatus Saccharibacteria bacterium]
MKKVTLAKITATLLVAVLLLSSVTAFASDQPASDPGQPTPQPVSDIHQNFQLITVHDGDDNAYTWWMPNANELPTEEQQLFAMGMSIPNHLPLFHRSDVSAIGQQVGVGLSPNGTTRAEFMHAILTYLVIEGIDLEAAFPVINTDASLILDIDVSTMAEGARHGWGLLWGYQRGIIFGDGQGYLMPDRQLTSWELNTIMDRIAWEIFSNADLPSRPDRPSDQPFNWPAAILPWVGW